MSDDTTKLRRYSTYDLFDGDALPGCPYVVYACVDVDAIIAAKDAEIARLERSVDAWMEQARQERVREEKAWIKAQQEER